jgi:hypothetical protein
MASQTAMPPVTSATRACLVPWCFLPTDYCSAMRRSQTTQNLTAYVLRLVTDSSSSFPRRGNLRLPMNHWIPPSRGRREFAELPIFTNAQQLIARRPGRPRPPPCQDARPSSRCRPIVQERDQHGIRRRRLRPSDGAAVDVDLARISPFLLTAHACAARPR